MTKANPRGVPASFPKGYNVTESAKMRGPRLRWQSELLSKYGEYILSLYIQPSNATAMALGSCPQSSKKREKEASTSHYVPQKAKVTSTKSLVSRKLKNPLCCATTSSKGGKVLVKSLAKRGS
ncbi:hypothetical protein QFC20_005084 [Naganishia adeliensis]|uniref:Uncharacterized protein n=1 Tax=Naganishia adeliensis TaxID=92952 RepID=A0ACC2VT56_9TREE|nr:hypothetical protein QFC20_005084 [Naganishia adeliensis]